MVQLAPPAAYKLKVALKGIKPPIWRRLVVPATCSLAKLHQAIQVAFGWEDCHLHLFQIRGEEFGPPDSEEIDGAGSERVSLKRLELAEGETFRYEYDFGDCWEHVITVEEAWAAELPPKVPLCIAGKRACPPEDCGGAYGYQDMLVAFRDPAHPRHEEMKEWLDTEWWDAEAFDLEEVNERLKRAFAEQWPRGAKKLRKV